jgi:uncharacterized membrane protein YcaP (DUF421 family)
VTPLVTVAGQTFAIYAFLVVCLLVVGRRQVAQITFVELVVIMVLGSAVETSMVAGDTRLIAGLVSATTLLLADRLLSVALARWTWLRRHVLGGPVLLIHDGTLLLDNLRRVGLTPADVESAIRERGYSGPEALRYAILEIDGSVGVIPIDAPVHRQPRSTDPVDSNSRLRRRSQSPGPRKPSS